jgi:hypothetical protein
MFKTPTSKALLTLGALSLVGGGSAAAITVQAANAAQTAQTRHHRADYAQGVIVKVSDTEMTIERHHKGDKSKTATTPSTAAKDDVTFELNKDTAVYRFGDKDHKLGVDALKVGDRVRVRYAEKDGKKTAKRIVILPDTRAGVVISKDSDSFVLRTRRNGDVKVTITDKTRFFTRDDSKHRKPGSFADLKVGDRAVALGEEDSQHNFDAAVVGYRVPDHGKTSHSQDTHS